MTMECGCCSVGREEVCERCKRPVPTLLDITTLKRVYSCMNSNCSQFLIVKPCGDKIGVALCKTCKVLGPNMRQAIENARVKRGN